MALQNEPKFNLIPLSIAAKTQVENVVKSDDLGVDLTSFPGLSRFYVRLVHAKHEREEKFEKREKLGTLSHVR